MNTLLREKLKTIYKLKKATDSQLGREINSNIQDLHDLKKSLTAENKEVVEEQMKNKREKLSQLLSEKRFKHDFPKFATFKAFVLKNKFSLQDLA